MFSWIWKSDPTSKCWLCCPFSRVFSWIVQPPALSHPVFTGSCFCAFWCSDFFLWGLQIHWIDINPHWRIQLSDVFKNSIFKFKNWKFLNLVHICRKHTSGHTRRPNPCQKGRWGQSVLLETLPLLNPDLDICVRLWLRIWSIPESLWRLGALTTVEAGRVGGTVGKSLSYIRTCSFLKKRPQI